MSDDIVAIVRPGTRVRYIESAIAPEGQVLIVDAHRLETGQLGGDVRFHAESGLDGLPVWDAEPWRAS